ncbi:MAG: acyl-CoA dehydrogenase family protein, partial [Ilumatobacteraceae bacterium]
MEFDWTTAESAYREQLRAFLSEERPGWREDPRHRRVLTAEDKAEVVDFTRKLAARKWLTSAWPEEYGGTGQTAWQSAILSEEMWSIGEPRGSQYMNVNWIGPAIMLAGTPEQKEFFLNQISRGEVFWAQGFSEPDAGSDLASLKTSA